MTLNVFTKIGADGQRLPASATDHVAVLDSGPIAVALARIHDPNATGLLWAINRNRRRYRWADAMRSVKPGWRVPSIDELLTLVDRRRHTPAIDTGFFPDVGEWDWFWSNTPLASSPSDYAWGVGFYSGDAYCLVHDYDGFVRAVRSVASPGQ